MSYMRFAEERQSAKIGRSNHILMDFLIISLNKEEQKKETLALKTRKNDC